MVKKSPRKKILGLFAVHIQVLAGYDTTSCKIKLNRSEILPISFVGSDATATTNLPIP
jgi:hypothetical protein